MSVAHKHTPVSPEGHHAPDDDGSLREHPSGDHVGIRHRLRINSKTTVSSTANKRLACAMTMTHCRIPVYMGVRKKYESTNNKTSKNKTIIKWTKFFLRGCRLAGRLYPVIRSTDYEHSMKYNC